MTNKRRRIPSTKVRYNRCKNCKGKYYGIEKDRNGKVLRVFDCRANCHALLSHLQDSRRI